MKKYFANRIVLNLGKFIFLLALLFSKNSFSQNDIRSKIDLERRDLSYMDDKTLDKARGYIRADSSFYIGYMYLGGFQFYRADDELGFAQVVVPLSNAMRLIEKDYDKELHTRSNDIFTYLKASNYQNDYCTIAYWLEQSYQNIEQPDKALEVLKHVRDRNLQLEQGIETYNTMAWIYHRNRMYSPKDGANYSFLKSTVHQNDSMAFMYLDSALIKLSADVPMNVGLFDATYLNRQYLFTYHYKAILFDYNLEIDSANFYYDELIRTGYYSSNNFAEFKMAMGEFETADEYFHEAEAREGGDEKRTKEFFYMRGTLDEYRGHPEDADSLLHNVLELQGSTPGFGWHSIGEARAQHYEGLTAESQDRINKAAKFHELHIATTWGQEQYNLAVATLNYTNQVNFAKEFYFENDQWYFWLNPMNWIECLNYSFKIHEYKLILAQLIAQNPERAQVIYTIFSSENLINFDEVWSAIDGFGNEFFIKIYKKLEATDKRPKIKKYFRYMIAKLFLAEGNEADAITYFQQVLNDEDINDPYNTLLYARCCEGMAQCVTGQANIDFWTEKMYTAFPQLVPFSDVQMKFNLVNANSNSANAKNIISQLKDCNLDFVSDNLAPIVSLSFSEEKDATEISYSVVSSDGGKVFQQGTLRLNADDLPDGGKLLAYRLFGIKKKKIGEQPIPVPQPKKDVKKKI